MYIKVIHSKDKTSIANEWDIISPLRNELIESGKDISFNKILVPCIISSLKNCNLEWVVDCGCGTGKLTSIIANRAKKVDGIDISKKSIEIAYNNNIENENVNLYNMSIEDYAEDKQENITLCIANMVFMNVVDLNKVLNTINKILKKDGILIFTITHPCYWSLYWNYANKSWFDYSKEIIMECQFSTTLSKNLGISTLVHRPLTYYINSLISSGFQILDIQEPYPENIIENDNYKFLYPRFLYVKCKKINSNS
ncbi:MAG: class I SAM-dependent methyltransferase [Eubacteriaceae bacterium]